MKIVFASDFHLGAPNAQQSAERERRIVRWLDTVCKNADALYLMGDVFDFWFEYRHAIPKGFVRLQGKLAELSDSGVEIHWFTGNHDMWIFDYLPEEIGLRLHRTPVTMQFGEKQFLIGHGDALGPGDKGYKFIKKVFASKLCQWLFARIHPNLGIGLAHYWSGRSRLMTGHHDNLYLGDDKEFLVQYCKKYLKTNKVDYFVFGHRHLPLDIKIEESRYINLGDWLQYNTYAVFNGRELELKTFSE